MNDWTNFISYLHLIDKLSPPLIGWTILSIKFLYLLLISIEDYMKKQKIFLTGNMILNYTMLISLSMTLPINNTQESTPPRLETYLFEKNFMALWFRSFIQKKKLLLRWDRWWNKEWVRVSIQLVHFMF